MNKKSAFLITTLFSSFLAFGPVPSYGSEQPFTLVAGEGDSHEYKKFVKNFTEEKGPLYKLNQFAEKGESSAVETLFQYYNKIDKEKCENFLRSLVEKGNVPAQFSLGVFLLLKNLDECLDYFEKAYTNKYKDLQLPLLYGEALIKFVPDKKESLQQAWNLLKEWQISYKKQKKLSHTQYVRQAYSSLLKKAHELSSKDLLLEIIEWEGTKKKHDNEIVTAIFTTLKGTDYINVFQEYTKLIAVYPEDMGYSNNNKKNKEVLVKEISDKDVLEFVKKLEEKFSIKEKDQKEKMESQKETVASRIQGTLSYLMQDDKEIMEFPQKKLEKFNLNSPSIEHLKAWTLFIVEKYHNEDKKTFTEYDGKDVLLKTSLKTLKKKVLKKHVLNAFKDIFFVE